MDKWNELKLLIEADLSYTVHYSSDKQFEHNSLRRVKEWMESLDRRDKQECIEECLLIKNNIRPKKETFYFSDVPDFDKKQWEKMLKNLEGLA